MKKDYFERMMADDESGRKFSVKEIVVFGVVVPLVMILVMGLTGWLETQFV